MTSNHLVQIQQHMNRVLFWSNHLLICLISGKMSRSTGARRFTSPERLLQKNKQAKIITYTKVFHTFIVTNGFSTLSKYSRTVCAKSKVSRQNVRTLRNLYTTTVKQLNIKPIPVAWIICITLKRSIHKTLFPA